LVAGLHRAEGHGKGVFMNRLNGIASVVAATLATAAYAQPAVFTDLGTHNTIVEQFQADVTITSPTDIQWYRVVLPDAPAASGGYVDIWTEAGGANPMGDVEIGIFDNAGNLIWNDDDNGVGLQSAMSFGGGSGLLIGDAFNLGGDGIGNGENGALAGGTYWVAVGRYGVTFAAGFNVVSTYTGAETTTTLRFAVAPATAPFPPNVTTVAANPNPAFTGAPVLLTATVTPGGNPVSTGIAVTCDLSGLGGSNTQAMYDNGTNGDVTAGDGVFSYSYTIPSGAAEQAYTVAMTATDAQARSGSRNVTFNVIAPAAWEEALNGGGDAGDLPNTAFTVSGSGPLASIGGNIDSGSDVDLFVIDLCEPANFIASTDNVTTIGDTQLWLFTMDGVGITHNDDKAGATFALKSELTSVNTASLAAGQYILGISKYNTDPVDTGAQLLWLACAGGGFTCETGPTGPGAANPVTAWTGTGTAGAYKIILQGACFAGGSSNCVADVDDGTATGNGDGAVTIDDLLYFLAQFEAGGVNADIDNGTGTGTTDGAVTIDDLLYFLVRFEAGC
jgi:hypothetical protein